MSEFEQAGKARFQIDESRHAPTRALVIVPSLGPKALARLKETPSLHRRSDAARLEEAVGLARAIDLDIVHAGIVKLPVLRPGTLMGEGKVEELKGIVEVQEAGLVVIDHPLTPVQQRNLERAWKAKVLDRTGLILEIFGARAQTKEGRLQVELAHLQYQRGRLVRSWTHLERQRGGGGFLGGPGETQIEADRRLLQTRILKLERELEQVRRTRTLHRAKRKRVPHPVVALVGYTNAGKSTLFNRLTGSEVLAKDMLFATLDPTLRRLTLPHGTLVILSDTVGFVSDLPTDLVAAFRATLEEVIEAELILHVRDMADPDAAAQADDVYTILAQLGIAEDGHAGVREVWNKMDAVDTVRRADLEAKAAGMDEPPVLVSARTGQGLEALQGAMERTIAGEHSRFDVTVPVASLGELDWIYRNAKVVEREDMDDGSVRLGLSAPQGVRAALDGRLGA